MLALLLRISIKIQYRLFYQIDYCLYDSLPEDTSYFHAQWRRQAITEIGKDYVQIKAPRRIKSVDIKTMPYPGFPTDMQSIFGALLSTAKGTSIITENIFENRYKYVQELNRMGARINVEGRTAIIKGTKRIQGANVVASDLRGGVALIIEALAAKGVTQVDNVHYILRGYENIEEKLKKLGSKIFLEK